MKIKALALAALLFPLALSAQVRAVPPIAHPDLGDSFSKGGIRITLIAKRQYYKPTDTLTADSSVRSPKSVSVTPDGTKFYVNALEGGNTVVFETSSLRKMSVVSHKITPDKDSLWVKSPQFFSFHRARKDPDTFTGKPVEGTFSHGGKYFWVPYYRRNYDHNAVEPSAVAVINTLTDRIVRIFETGPLPKMIATSPDSKIIAVTHWGDNTVGLIDIASWDPAEWHYSDLITVEYKLALNFSPSVTIDRDVNSGFCLRGTVFTPDGKYLLVGCMGGSGGIAVIDMTTRTYLGRIFGMRANLRHLVLRDGWLYMSINNAGYIQKVPLQTILDAIPQMKGRMVRISGITECKVPAGARTIELSPDGKYIFAACNFSSRLAIVDAEKMEKIGEMPVDSYPVGLDLSRDGSLIFVTSQARMGYGGNCIGIYRLEYY